MNNNPLIKRIVTSILFCSFLSSLTVFPLSVAEKQQKLADITIIQAQLEPLNRQPIFSIDKNTRKDIENIKEDIQRLIQIKKSMLDKKKEYILKSK